MTDDVRFLDDQYDKSEKQREHLPSGLAGILVKHQIVKNPLYARIIIIMCMVTLLGASLLVSITAAAPTQYDEAQVLELTNDDFIDYTLTE